MKTRFAPPRQLIRLTSGLGLFILILLLALAAFPSAFAPFDATERVALPLQKPNDEFILGTNDIGQDLFSELIAGTRASLFTGLIVAFLSILIGAVIGLASGTLGGWTDSLLMRLTDLILVLPFLPLVILIAVYLGPSQRNVILVLAIFFWAAPARLIRSQVLSMKSEPYIEAARAGSELDSDHGISSLVRRETARVGADRSRRIGVHPRRIQFEFSRLGRPLRQELGLDVVLRPRQRSLPRRRVEVVGASHRVDDHAHGAKPRLDRLRTGATDFKIKIIRPILFTNLQLRLPSTPMLLEETLAYEFALRWRDDSYRPNLQHVDWTRFAHLLTHNRMAVLAAPILERVNASIPHDAQNVLTEQVEKYKRSASKLGQALASYLREASLREPSSTSVGIETIVLKGLWLCEKIYGNSAMRPGGDIDILVRKDKVEACLALLEKQGVGQFWHNLMHDDYFTRHHLHQQRCTADLNIWFEIHWALDHPYTLLTVDYESIFARAKPAQLLGAPIQEMALPDLLLSLAIHLVKHAVYLPSLVNRDDLPRIILADGMLMYCLDIAEIIKQHSGMDWGLAIQLAREWGAVDILGSALHVCKRYFDAPVPDQVIAALTVKGPWRITKTVMARVAEQELATDAGKRVSRFWKLMLASNGAFILRPIRLLETASYFFPPADFLKRRYGNSNILTACYHLVEACFQTLRFGWDSIYFGIERYLRLKRLGESASLFNKLETDL